MSHAMFTLTYIFLTRSCKVGVTSISTKNEISEPSPNSELVRYIHFHTDSIVKGRNTSPIP